MNIFLTQPITLTIFPYTDPKTNQIVRPDPLVLNELVLSFEDISSRKLIIAKIEKFPYPIILYANAAYDQLGNNWTKQDLANKLLSMLGDDPGKFLQGLVPKTLEADPNGPGSILSGMLHALGINSTPTCSCRRRALEMNSRGPDWCENNLEQILGWLEEEAKKRKLPFVKTVAKLMVQRAISKSRRLLAKQQHV